MRTTKIQRRYNEDTAKVLRSIYSGTQAFFKGRGQTGTQVVYRGVDAKQVDKRSPLESWTTDKEEAEDFALESPFNDGLLQEAKVPASAILATYEREPSLREEKEIIVIGGVLEGLRMKTTKVYG